MIRVLLIGPAVAACSPTYQTVRLVNRTDRAIEQIYIYPTGSANHGASRGSLAPNASTAVNVQPGNVDVLAVSAKVRVDETSSETRTATQTIELKGPLELVFHDSNQPPPAGLARPGTVGVTFRISAPSPAPAQEPDAP
ncbi:MAG: hypothetical protein H0T79_01790 [Deltaproteobacteria bacterium]|nr:hypothetical protein [Deltaproteobacteria bacterium]